MAELVDLNAPQTNIPIEQQHHTDNTNARDNLVLFFPKASHTLTAETPHALIIYKDASRLLATTWPGYFNVKRDKLMDALSGD